jgi:hypothetical protein
MLIFTFALLMPIVQMKSFILSFCLAKRSWYRWAKGMSSIYEVSALPPRPCQRQVLLLSIAP